MLLPEKHISLAESILGLGAFVLSQLDRARSVDDVYRRVVSARETTDLPAYHDFDATILAILFLFTVEAVELTDSGRIRQCD